MLKQLFLWQITEKLLCREKTYRHETMINKFRESKLRVNLMYSILHFSHSVMASSLQPYVLQHARFPCPLSLGVCSNSCPLSRWCHPTISSSIILFSSCLQSFLASGLFQWFGCIRWPKYSSFSSNEYLGLISFRSDWFDLLESPRDSQEYSLIPQFKSINSLVLSLLYDPTHICTWLMEKP